MAPTSQPLFSPQFSTQLGLPGLQLVWAWLASLGPSRILARWTLVGPFLGLSWAVLGAVASAANRQIHRIGGMSMRFMDRGTTGSKKSQDRWLWPRRLAACHGSRREARMRQEEEEGGEHPIVTRRACLSSAGAWGALKCSGCWPTEVLLLEVLVPVWALWLFAGPCCPRRTHCPPFVFLLPLNEPPLAAKQLRCATLKAGNFGTAARQATRQELVRPPSMLAELPFQHSSTSKVCQWPLLAVRSIN
ncbi:uncharacterized protein CTHT_0030180 [Thermochaetoides thermophila DSM 1495]|uniref:Uncharacterized protein n=1 Tax=Chaetomium thermophilum (strain DSM 1495 / CBS 144.50 / IMI 039719) TaxID=759272 RepID=G0S3Q0_CHATD|nr:hypothetical protein CTHT_0030180 [Thermochaetoides thermophila DSM 1495]EGS21176.1 hypothetical protein CTHT_0030180 [Thermochaetoides thermophila DSM 1495]